MSGTSKCSQALYFLGLGQDNCCVGAQLPGRQYPNTPLNNIFRQKALPGFIGSLTSQSSDAGILAYWIRTGRNKKTSPHRTNQNL